MTARDIESEGPVAGQQLWCRHCLGTGWTIRRMWSYRLHDYLDVRTACEPCHGTGEA